MLSKKAAIVGVLAVTGFVAGYASTWLGGHQYYVSSALWLPRHHSPDSPKELVAMTAGHHPGSEVHSDGGNKINVYATGSIQRAESAVEVGYRAVLYANHLKFRFLPYNHVVDQMDLTWGNPSHRGWIGM